LPYNWGPKDIFPERDKFCLEGMKQTLKVIGTSEVALPGVAGKIK
jgi:hypothetical protein